MNLIAGTPLELKYSLKFILNFKWWTSFEIGQSAAKVQIIWTRLNDYPEMEYTQVSGNGAHPLLPNLKGWRYSLILYENISRVKSSILN